MTKDQPAANTDETAPPESTDAGSAKSAKSAQPAAAESTETAAAPPAAESAESDESAAPEDQSAQPADDPAALSAQELRDLLEAAQADHAQAKDALLRARAETENVRRRAQNEIVSARKFAIEGFARELLSVKDSLDRASAVELDEKAGDAVKRMKEGLGLTLKQLDLAMARFAVVEVEAAPGVRFDPERHQAVSMAPSEDIDADHIVEVVQKGFLLKERLLRPAMVVVAKP